jgi:predicted TIM-barrel fold metal-dependent hydrolase
MTRATILQEASQHVSSWADKAYETLPFKPISADSHVAEPPNCYIDHIDPKYRDIAPRVEAGPTGGAVYVIDDPQGGKAMRIPISALACAGVDPKQKLDSWTYADINPGGFDGKARLAAQDEDGIAGEIIFPSIGMVLCNHVNPAYKAACFEAYNRWLQQFQSADPTRIFGIGQTAVSSVKDAIADLQRIKDMGFRGVLMPCEPCTEMDYDDETFDPLWEAAVALEMPLCFHILTSRSDGSIVQGAKVHRGKGKANFQHTVIRANQDVISMFIWGRVFERFPALRIVCVEADAGWAPHFMYRLDHWYNRHRYWQGAGDMPKMPSEYFADNIYMTFQDDAVAFRSLDSINPRRLLWANDFPHSDSTWPWSQQLLAQQTAHLSTDERRWILRDNVVELFNLPVA